VASETDGTWGKAMPVPGLGALNHGKFSRTFTMSCSSAGFCSAGGAYTDRSFHDHAFVVTETNGTWGTAIQVPGTKQLGSGGGAETGSLSCGSAGNCSAGGSYGIASNNGNQAFVVTEANGIWGTAIEVPGSAALNTGDDARVSSVSCAAAGKCSAVGSYFTSSRLSGAFVVSES